MKRKLMRCRPALALSLVVLAANGCLLVPGGRRQTLGHEFSPEELAFLKTPGTKREEVLSTLGPPLWEAFESRVMLYMWETSRQWYIVDPWNRSGYDKENSKTRRMGLFIAYDTSGAVTSHEVRRIGKDPPEMVCALWLKEKEVAR